MGKSLSLLVAANLLIAVAASAAGDEAAPHVRGDGLRREMRLAGRVVDAAGRTVTDAQVTAHIKRQFGRQPLECTIDGAKFETWVPIGGDDWFHVELVATSPDGRQRCFEGLANYALRAAAIDGVELLLEPTKRTATVTVTYQGKPVGDAHVVAETSDSPSLSSTTDSNGRATFPLCDDEEFRQLTAWTDDHRLGGYSFSRKPRRDPLAAEHTIELVDCRDQTIRMVHADDNAPIADVAFTLTIGTGRPNYNFPAVPQTFPPCYLQTDQHGEAVMRWFPDWEKHGAYVEIDDDRWARASEYGLQPAEDGALVMPLKPRVERQTLTGLVTSDQYSVAHLMVQVQSFQGEEERYSDHLNTFTDSSGRFTVGCIPGSTYCVHVADAQLVSNIIDLIPYDPATEKRQLAVLNLKQPQPVEIRLTAGKRKAPIVNQWVNLREVHSYQWREEGDTQAGSGGRSWGGYTDADGVVRTVALPGAKLDVAVYSPQWRSGNREYTVGSTGVTTIDIHRQIEDSRAVSGRLIAPPDMQVEVADAQVVLGSIDGETDERQTTQAAAGGHFTFESKAIDAGVFAYTADGRAAGYAKYIDFDQPIEVELIPTSTLTGQLLDAGDRPLVDQPVYARARIEGKRDFTKGYSTSFTARTFETTTDEQGNFTLRHLPANLDMELRTASLDDPDDDTRLGSFSLKPGESPPVWIARLGGTAPAPPKPLAEQYDTALRDAKLGGWHLLVAVYDASAVNFVDRYVLDDDRLEQVATYMHLEISDNDDMPQADRAFLEQQALVRPDATPVLLCAIDGEGHELARLAIDPKADDAEQQAAEFVIEHAPPPVDAAHKWDEAFAEAARTDRKVWARVSQRYCGPCFRLSRWLDDHRQLLEQDYVLLKIDNVRDLHGGEVAERIVGDRAHFGVPFHTIFAANGTRLIDSEGDSGNVGFPASYSGRQHAREMLMQTRKQLSDAEVEQLILSLE